MIPVALVRKNARPRRTGRSCRTVGDSSSYGAIEAIRGESLVTQQVAERLEGELGDEQPFFIEGCQRDWDALPRPDGPLTVGIDGGYVHARDGDNRKAGWFELIVGKSVPSDGAGKCFGFVTSYDTKPKRRLAELLKAQGLQMNQAITFLSEGPSRSPAAADVSHDMARTRQQQPTRRSRHSTITSNRPGVLRWAAVIPLQRFSRVISH